MAALDAGSKGWRGGRQQAGIEDGGVDRDHRSRELSLEENMEADEASRR